MKKIQNFIKAIFVEFFIISILIFLINNYIGKVQTTLNADGVGYYDYLPSLFIHHDLVRKDKLVQKDTILYKRIIPLQVYVDYKNHMVNRYPCGTAILELPFFTYAYAKTKLKNDSSDGYQYPFQKSVFYAAIFYLFMSIYFLKKILELYHVRKKTIVITQILLVFATTVTNYVNFDAGFSHVYSLFAVTAFFFFSKSYFNTQKINYFIYACIFLGLVLLIRQINIITILFLPFLAGSFSNLKKNITYLFKKISILFIGISIISGLLFIQLYLFYLQTGSFFVDSYQGYNFNFLDPEFINILFSYRKGLFVYTPIAFVSILGLITLARKKEWYLLISWLSFFIILTYVLSSWFCWYYGCSFGLRAYIDFYSIFFILLALLIDSIKKRIYYFILGISFLLIPINIIQTYQYKEYILHWVDMKQDKYWKVFLRTSDSYKGLLWKKEYDYKKYILFNAVNAGSYTVIKHTIKTLYTINSREISGFNKATMIQLRFSNDFNSFDESQIVLNITDLNEKKKYYWNKQYLIHFHEQNLNQFQTGLLNFEIIPITDTTEKIINIELISDKFKLKLDSLQLLFYRAK